jgi:hypothetical protein
MEFAFNRPLTADDSYQILQTLDHTEIFDSCLFREIRD